MNKEQNPNPEEKNEAPTKSSNEEEAPKISVIDKRHWAEENEAEEQGEEDAKPTYIAELEKQLGEKDARITDILTKHKMAIDEFENSKARLRRDLTREIESGRRAFFSDILEVLDTLDRAIDAADENHDAESLLAGIEMVRTLFLNKLEGYSIKRFETMGSEFNPNRHEAISTVPASEGVKDGQIVGVIKEGYLIGDETLRPATVAVAKAQ
ncbi:MAG: nucleotide exchange factor GrpE [Myxococcales bacterium]|nr:nucleotide exchange factor GrpE [Myxococcales bacterium]|tara:strand:- start:60 stop:692 length:633 start_codon:yes stop_codon:yes gene_type:complete